MSNEYKYHLIKLFETNIIGKLKISLPVIKENNMMYFHEWKKNDVLKINRFGMLEPVLLSKRIVPDVMLVPLLAYDSQNNRLGFGRRFYDRYLNKYLKGHNNILTIGIAFSFQKYKKLPISNFDVKLDQILTEKGFENKL